MICLVSMGTLPFSKRKFTLQRDIFAKCEVIAGTKGGRWLSGKECQLNWHRLQVNLASGGSGYVVFQTVAISKRLSTCFAEVRPSLFPFGSFCNSREVKEGTKNKKITIIISITKPTVLVRSDDLAGKNQVLLFLAIFSSLLVALFTFLCGEWLTTFFTSQILGHNLIFAHTFASTKVAR